MASFDEAIEVILDDEGGYAPQDNGRGAVNMGITQKTLDMHWIQFPSVCESIGLPRKVEGLTKQKSIDFYRQFFWLPWFNSISSQAVANVLFTLAVNRGPAWPLKYSRVALAGLNLVQPDLTITQRLNSADEQAALEALYDAAMDGYIAITEKNPALYADDLPGWEKRMAKRCNMPPGKRRNIDQVLDRIAKSRKK